MWYATSHEIIIAGIALSVLLAGIAVAGVVAVVLVVAQPATSDDASKTAALAARIRDTRRTVRHGGDLASGSRLAGFQRMDL